MRVFHVCVGIVLCVCGSILFNIGRVCAGDVTTGYETRKQAVIEELNRRNIHVYGLVVDQNRSPVKEAEVLIDCEEFATPLPGPIKKKWIKTDDEGRWDFGQRAMRLMVREARCEGYVFDLKQQDFGGIVSDDVKNNRTSPTRRIVLRLHKTVEPVFLMTDEADLVRVSMKEPVHNQFDVFRRMTLPITDVTNYQRSAFYPDLETRVDCQGSNGLWHITYLTLGDGDGLFATNVLLFEAPATGYVPECTLAGSHRRDFPRYLYLRTRTPPVYTRIEMNYSLRTDSCILSYELCTNPYGTRSLEPNVELEPLWQLREQLTKEARIEITAGRYLKRDELLKRVKEAKKKRTGEGSL